MTYKGLFLESIIIYYIYRGVLIPLKKNYKNSKINKDLSIFIFGPLFGLVNDLSRLLGFTYGYLKKIIK